MTSGGRARIAPVSCVLPGVQDRAQCSRQEDKARSHGEDVKRQPRPQRSGAPAHPMAQPGGFCGEGTKGGSLHVLRLTKENAWRTGHEQ